MPKIVEHGPHAGRTRDELKLELQRTKVLAVEARAMAAIRSDDIKGDSVQSSGNLTNKSSALYLQDSNNLTKHAKELEAVLNDSKNGTFYQRNGDAIKRNLFYLSVISELTTIPLLVWNGYELLTKKKNKPILDSQSINTYESINPQPKDANSLIAQNPIIAEAQGSSTSI